MHYCRCIDKQCTYRKNYNYMAFEALTDVAPKLLDEVINGNMNDIGALVSNSAMLKYEN